MEGPFPPLSPSISPVPEQEPPPTTTPYSTDFMFYFLVIYFMVSLTFLLGKFICNQLFPCSQQVHDPDRTPVIIYIDDSSSSSSSSSSSPDTPSELGRCPICLEELGKGEGACVLPRCRHVYHQACIDQWLIKGSDICPLCRERVMHAEMDMKVEDQSQ